MIAGPPSIEERTKAAMEALFPGSSKITRRFDVRFAELPELGRTEIGSAHVTAFPVEHATGAASYGLRVEYGGKVIAYSGDTEWTDALIELARGADIFVCETYFFDKTTKFHLSYETLAKNLDRLDCERVILTHPHQSTLDRQDEIELEVAHDGLVLPL